MPELKSISVPALGAPWPGQGGLFMGLLPGQNAGETSALIFATARPPKDVKWQAALDWAQSIEAEGHRDFHVPDRLESRLLAAIAGPRGLNLIPKGWFWISEQYSASDAWCQTFAVGYQDNGGKGSELQALAVRRFLIPSVLQSF